MGVGTKWNQSKINPHKWIKDYDQQCISRVKKGENVGVHIDFFTWNTLVRWGFSFGVGIFLGLIAYVLDVSLEADLFDIWLWLGCTALLAYSIGRDEKEMEIVPEGRMAMISWFGIPFRAYRHTGEYTWTGRRLRFSRVKRFKEPMTDPEGYFWTDAVQVNIWNIYESDAKKRTNLLKSLTKTGGEITANLLLMLRMRDPMLWVRKTDPMMDIGERARMSFRTAVSFFTGKDAVSVKNLLTELMSGRRVITCFINKQVNTLAKHSLMRNRGGDPIYVSVEIPDELSEEDKVKEIEKGKKELLKIMDATLDPTLSGVLDKEGDLPVIEIREVNESLDEVLMACGVTLERASVGFIGLPDEVVHAANQADAQPYQLATQRSSAQAAKEARDLLRPTEEDRNDPTFADRQAYAAASDPDSRVNVTHISGLGGNGGNSNDPLGLKGAAAVVAASLNNKGGKK